MTIDAPSQLAQSRSQRLNRIVSRDQLALVADDTGPLDAPVVILLHGGGQTRHSWSGAAKALSRQGYRVINFDARGHGESGWSDAGAYALDDRVADLEAIVTQLDQPFALVGASLGGMTSIHAVAQDIRPAAVVLVDIVPHPEPQGISRIVTFMRAHPDGFATLDAAVDAVAAYNPDRPRPRDPAGLMRNLRQRENGRFYWHWDPRIVSDRPQTFHETVQKSAVALAETGLPVLVVRGLKSDVVSDAGIAAFRAIVSHLEVADVGGAGHMVAGDRNDAFNGSVIAFLERHLPVELGEG
ncbi:alpha/beta hydrolase [Novosphingobium sp. PASSN1]|uniref:alpha/beta fold hydrolase n=1 Tax=Novosphingobium sp. PASSN1 TaxID=2015561 RepID=UPI000BD6A5F2|nr:alpha/beta hydrolase [Novosphingobium sp. PASSN1]OYU36889.1 MAG: alpha/beta hydrolase [Novosphingobium sp. PASSN1]